MTDLPAIPLKRFSKDRLAKLEKIVSLPFLNSQREASVDGIDGIFEVYFGRKQSPSSW